MNNVNGTRNHKWKMSQTEIKHKKIHKHGGRRSQQLYTVNDMGEEFPIAPEIQTETEYILSR